MPLRAVIEVRSKYGLATFSVVIDHAEPVQRWQTRLSP